jgi:ABC-type nitrate/sulfonate/bicarbonate transport system permease component
VDASRWDVFWRVRLPHAGPFLAAGARTGVTLSLVGAVVAEWTGGGRGLGYLVLSANGRLAVAQAFAAVFVICLLGLAAYGAVGRVERWVGWWNRSDLDRRRMLS